ncbi:beta-galactosidase [Cellulomonas triticagri]|uniref:Beta-galactosidase n=1 Tax=Cellulomonas triticagri TaxID=2483352 RepID=A0A3M2JM90_9CELL|nr:beta-galactosidase [Cellulomonas triticagri]RMI12940.1 beta-galactosidase [Cellulomonas triticagri]
MRAYTHPGIAFGCDWNPEQWDPAVWREDVRLMRDAGVDLVAVNVFGWSQVEPRPGEYDFTALDEVMDLLAAHGIRANLGTGTSSTPPWLTTAHPEVLPVAADGTTRWPGGRQAFCPSSPVYRERSLALVDAVATRYGDHPALALWHVSNELGCHNALCYCDASAAAFRTWLRERYADVAALNAAWGTTFWSQRYGSFDEVLPPRLTLSTRNPGQVLDFHRFSSDALLDQLRAETAVIRARSAAPVTTNFMVTDHIRNLDYLSWAPYVDVVANDHYLDHRLADPTTELAFSADLTRGIAGGAPWLLMEHSTGAVNWQPVNVPKGPGEMLRNSLTHVARGADAVCFFQWRASTQGSEKFHSALVPHAGTATRQWREAVELGTVLDRLDEVAGSRVQADVAVLFGWESWWTLDGENVPSTAVRYRDQVVRTYAALRAQGVTVDVVGADAPLDGYRAVVVPALHVVRDADAAAVARFAEAGGTVLVTFASGVVDEHDAVRLGGYPGAFRDLLGVTVEEFAPVLPDQVLTLDTGERAGLWSERFAADPADAGTAVLSRFADGPAAGEPAITRRAVGSGSAWYVATALDAPDLADLMGRVLADAGVATAPDLAAAGVERVVRAAADGRRWTFLVNHAAADVTLPARGHELVTDTAVAHELVVPARAVRVLREEPVR